MKKYFLFLLLFVAISLQSCHKNTPKAVAEQYLTSILVNTNVDEAKKYCDPMSQEIIDQATELNPIPDSIKLQMKQNKVTIVDVKEVGSQAVVTYTTTKHPEKQYLNLVKNNDKWLVKLSKVQEEAVDVNAAPTAAPTELAADTTTSTVIDTSSKAAEEVPAK